MRRLLVMAVIGGLVLAPRAAAWSWPADGAVLKPFDFDPNHPYAAGQHRGIDVAGGPGADVVAPSGGSVSFAGSVPTSGKVVTIQTPGGYSVTLVHLGSISVSTGAAVDEGSIVGTIGPSGDAEWPEPYVHLGIRVTSEPQGYVDPLDFLPPRLVPILAPPAGQASTPDPVSDPAMPSPTLTEVAPAPPPLTTESATLPPVSVEEAPAPAVSVEEPAALPVEAPAAETSADPAEATAADAAAAVETTVTTTGTDTVTGSDATVPGTTPPETADPAIPEGAA